MKKVREEDRTSCKIQFLSDDYESEFLELKNQIWRAIQTMQHKRLNLVFEYDYFLKTMLETFGHEIEKDGFFAQCYIRDLERYPLVLKIVQNS